MLSADTTNGYDVGLTLTSDRLGDSNLDQAQLVDDTIWLADFDLKCAPFAALTSGLLTLTFPNAVAAGMSLQVDLAADPWPLSTVTGLTAPAGVGTPVLTGALPAIAAGGTVVLDLAAVFGDVLDGTTPQHGIRITRLDAGPAATFWTFNAADETVRPTWSTSYEFPLPKPTNVSPRDGKVVSKTQVLIRVLDYAVQLGALELSTMTVQWALTPGGTVLATDTLPVSAPYWQMADAPSHFALPALAALRSYRVKLTSAGGVDSPWSDWFTISARPTAAAAFTNPLPYPGNVLLDSDPLYSWTSPGQAYFQLVLTDLNGAPDVVLADSRRQSSVATSAVLGVDVVNYQSKQIRLRTWDAYNREDIPGAPAYSEAAATWSLADDPTVHPPTDITIYSLSPGAPFNVLEWSHDKLTGVSFGVRRGPIGEGAKGDRISGIIDADVLLVGEDERGYRFRWIDWTARPGFGYDYRPQTITEHRGSAGGDIVSIISDGWSAYLADPVLGEWIQILSYDPGNRVRTEPTSMMFASANDDPYWHKIQGQRLGWSTAMGGELWPDDLHTAEEYRETFLRIAASGNPLILTDDRESVRVWIKEPEDDPMDWPDERPYAIRFFAAQAGAQLEAAPLDDGEVATTWITFDSWADGATITAADPSLAILSISGRMLASAASALHGSPMGAVLKDDSGGSNARVIINGLNGMVDAYFPTGFGARASDVNVIKFETGGGGLLGAIHIETSGALDIRDSSSNRQPGWSTKKIPANTACRIIGCITWVDGVATLRAVGWYGPNLEGANPDIDITAPVPALAAPGNTARIGPTQTFGGGDIRVEDIRLTNATDTLLPPLGVPAGGTLSTAHASAKSYNQVIVQATGIAVATTVKLAYSTSLDAHGQPNAPAYGPAVPITVYGTARLATPATLAGRTRYYWSVADGTTGIMFGPVGDLLTLYAPNTAGSLKIAQYSCQNGGKSTSTAAWDDLFGFAPDVTIGQGDFNYPGGTYTPTTPVQKHIDKTYVGQLLRLPGMNNALLHTSNEDQCSDHENCANGQYQLPGAPDGVYGPWTDQLAIFQANILAMVQARPVEYADTAAIPRGRYYAKDLFRNRPGGLPSVRLIMLDCRTLDRSDGTDPDGPAKTFLGSPQMGWLASTLLTNGLNILSFEGTMYVGADANIDKWSNFFYELQHGLKTLLTGKQCDWWAGDRHAGGFLDHTQNPILPDVDICLASGMEEHGLGLSTDELYKDAAGITRTFGFVNDPDNWNRQYGRHVITDDNAGNITRDFTFWDARTASSPFPTFSRTFHYT